jgi:replicative superfamily II helicase
VRTVEYRWYQPPFPEFNEAQEAVVQFFDQDVNLVVAFPTAAGKTVVAECCFGYHLETDEAARVAYVCPYKGLASQRFEEWVSNGQLAAYGVLMSSGDNVPSEAEWERCRIAVFTVESFDSKTRSRMRRGWMKGVACAVLDEAHLLGESVRGAALEASVMRFSDINPGSRIVMLSATMGNALEVARWVKSLNGKPTKCVRSSYRPSDVSFEFRCADRDGIVEEAVAVVSGMRGKRLVFVHSKRLGAKLVRELASRGVRCGFHNASVPKSKRERMESLFDDGASGFDVLVSTSTLGAGVNIG